MPSNPDFGKITQRIVEVYDHYGLNDHLRDGYSAGVFTDTATDTTHIHILARGVAGHHTVFRAIIVHSDNVKLTTGGRKNIQYLSGVPQP